MKFTDCQIFAMAFALLLPLPGCQKKAPQKTKEQVIGERVAERLERWESDVEQRCIDNAMDIAIVIVDSTIIANARTSRDTSGKPGIPPRPQKPAFEIPEDSTPVKPFLREKTDTSQ